MIQSTSNSSSSIICFFGNGVIFAVDQLPISELCSNENTQTLLAKLRFSKFATQFQNPIKVLILSPDQSPILRGCVIDSASQLHLIDFGSPSSLVVTTIFTFPDPKGYSDVVSLSTDLVLLLSNTQQISVFNVTTQEMLGEINFLGVASPLIRGLNTFLTATFYRDPREFILFSLISLSVEDQVDQPNTQGIHSYVLVGSKAILPFGSSQFPTKDLNDSLYSLGQFNSGATSDRFVSWVSGNEISVKKYSVALTNFLDGVRSASNSLIKQFQDHQDAVITVRDLKLNDSFVDYCGYLLQSQCPIPSSLLTQLLYSFRNFSPDEILLLLKLLFQNQSITVDRYSDILLAAQPILESHAKSTDENFEEFEEFLNAYITSSENNWIEDSTGNQKSQFNLVSQRLFVEDELSDTPSLSQISRQFFSLIGRVSSEKTWIDCILKSSLKASSSILQRQLRNILPESLEKVIRMPNLGSCPIPDFVEWFTNDILPQIHGPMGSNINIDEVCKYLISTSLEIEKRDRHPYNAILLSQLALNIATSELVNYTTSGDKLLEEIQSIHASITLQVAVWINWSVHLPFQFIFKGGLKSILSIRLKTHLISDLQDDIAMRIRPLMDSYQANVDQMLLDWILYSVDHSVVLLTNEEEEIRPEFEETFEEPRNVHIRRLVLVSSSIQVPNFQAQAVICLLQTLTLPSAGAQIDPSEVMDEEALGELFHHLETSIQQIHGRVSNTIADSLDEALRSYKLRQLSLKYKIRSFNSRDSRQVRDAIDLILSKIHIPTSIPDALCFAEGYSTSGIDISNILVKALIHRLLPISTTRLDTLDKENLVRSALEKIPLQRALVVFEDVTFYLTNFIEEIVGESEEIGVNKGNIGSSSYEIFSSAVHGALIIVNYFMDNFSCNSNQSETDQVGPELSVSGSNMISLFITPDLQTNLKKMKKLILEFSVYISPNQMKERNTCTEILNRIAIERTDEFIIGFQNQLERNTSIENQTAVIEVMRASANQFIKLRKLCLLLDGSYVSLLSSMMKYCLGKGQMVIPSSSLFLNY
jgi:hypothetical protein